MKSYIFAPGPTSVPPEVLLAGAKPTMHHRAPDFEPVFRRVQEKVRKVFLTANPVVLLASSGTGAVESAMVSTVSPGEKVLVFNAGKFGERWVEIAKAYQMNCLELAQPWGEAADVSRVAKLLADNPDTKAVVVTQTETSTGTVSDIKAIADVVRKTSAITIVDAVSSFAAEELRSDEWGVDMVCTGSQKAIMLPPGLGFVSVSDKARAMMAGNTCPKYYFDLRKYLKALDQLDVPFTPPVNLIFSLDAALDMLLGAGMEETWARHTVTARAGRAGMVAMGCPLFSKRPSCVTTTFAMPEGVDCKKLNKELKTRGITVAGGQDQLKDKVLRFATLGYYDIFDVVTIVSAIDMGLASLGHKYEFGSGVSAAMKVLRHWSPEKGWAAAEKATRDLEPVKALLPA